MYNEKSYEKTIFTRLFLLDVYGCKGYNINDKKLTKDIDGQWGFAVRFV